MQIHLTQDELKLAVRDYIMKMGITRPIGEITFTATRGDAGIVTEVDITAQADQADSTEETALTAPIRGVSTTPAVGPVAAVVEEGAATAEPETMAEEPVEEEEADAEGTPGKSLFG